LQGAAAAACLAPVLIVIAFGLLYYSETFKKGSDVVQSLSLETAADVKGQTGMHKFTGKPVITKSVIAPNVGEVIYYSSTQQIYKEVEETETDTVTEVRDGQQIEKTVERKKLVEKWVDTATEEKWADFRMGDITVKATKSSPQLNLNEKEYRTTAGTTSEITPDSVTPLLGDTRLLLSYLSLDGELLVVGEVSQNTVASGDVFIVSNLTDAELLASLQSVENTQFWIFKILSWLFLFMGFSSILKPLTAVLDFIPFFGGALNGVIGVVSAVLAAIIIILGGLVIKFWWVCIGGFILLIAVAAFLIATRVRRQPPDKK